MNQLKGLYISLILIMAVNLVNFTFFNGKHTGVAMYLTVILFFFATLF